MSNYKLEVENTEKLNNDISSAFTEINAELKKDDDLIASDLFDVDRCIEGLKKSRKKWASGTGGVSIIRDIDWDNISLNLSGLQFNPTIVLCVMISDNGEKLEWTPIINSKNYYIKPKYNDSRVWNLTQMTIHKSEHNKGNITVIQVTSYPSELAKNLTWYAFE